jgi:hypothetical protein
VGGDRERDAPPHVREAELLLHEAPEPVDAAVLVVGGEHLVARPDPQAARDDVHRGRPVADVDQVVALGVEVAGEHGARAREPFGRVAREEVDRLALELHLPALVRLEDRPRRRAVRAVVEVRHARVEQEPILERAALGRASQFDHA